MGHRSPRKNHPRLRWCPPCWRRGEEIKLTSRHVWGECPAVARTRSEVGIKDFQEACSRGGYSRQRSFREYLNGEGPEDECNNTDYMKRGRALAELQEVWIATWDP